jgi:hypothetical protein
MYRIRESLSSTIPNQRASVQPSPKNVRTQ